jgi:hypothetical protein
MIWSSNFASLGSAISHFSYLSRQYYYMCSFCVKRFSDDVVFFLSSGLKITFCATATRRGTVSR